MTRHLYEVTIQLPVPPRGDGCEVVVSLGTRAFPVISEVVADGLGMVAAVGVANRVRTLLDKGETINGVIRCLKSGEGVA